MSRFASSCQGFVRGLLLSLLPLAAGCADRPASPPRPNATSSATESPATKNVVSAKASPPSPDVAKAAADGPTAAHAVPTNSSAGGPRAKRPKFNPVEVNGKFFEGWKTPKLALVITGRQDGYLEPCGCAGIENQKGGLSRRASMMEQLAQQGWPVAAVDVGSLVRRFGKQAELQYATCAAALREMKYSAVGFGSADLRLSAGEVAAVVAGDQPDKTIFVSANVDLLGLVPRVRTFVAGGMKFGVTSVLGDEFRQQVNNNELELKPAAVALQEVVGQLAGCDHRILLANATMEECEVLAKKFPQFDVVVSGGGADEPPAEPVHLAGDSLLIEVGHKAMYAIVLGYYDDPKPSVRYQRVALDSRFPDSPEMKNLMTVYQSQLQSLGWDGLGLRAARQPQSRPDNPLAGKFVGGQNCKECHEAAWDVYAKSPHAHATQTLIDLKPARHFDPECVSCHVTGWNPQEFFPFNSGYQSMEATPELAGQSCENCHGPGAAHIAAERGDDKALQDEWRKIVHQDKKNAADATVADSCYKCHDIDNSPNFNTKEFPFEVYWAEIAH